ncbi:urea transporter [Mucilaginibacter terrae]|uniref:urea transporter n=1 Tax=Mucilaginibacter terrae TaxID=1955052 RepID=UPI00289CD02B|nr:urea transporter [Mucilaginibacter terrae]
MKKRILHFFQALLNSYAILFFSQNSVLGALLVVVSFFNPAAGLSGLVAVCASLLLVNALGFVKENIQAGLYTFNSLLLGIGLGTFYYYNTAFWLWLGAACVITVVLSVTLTAWLGKYGLPALSLPFVLAFWLLLSAVTGYTEMGLLPKESYMLNELSPGYHSSANMLFAGFNQMPLPPTVSLFFRALSAVLFQDNVMAGIVMSIGLFIHSRISFSLLVLGFAAACLLNGLTHIYPDGVSHYHLGVNFMMVTVAIGGFFLIPSWRSYLWAVVGVPVAFLVVGACTKMLSIYSLPVLSLPFCIITLSLLYFFILRANPGRLQLTPVQHYSPETNLYQYYNNRERQHDAQYFKLNLPFMGSWTVTQGYHGDITHKGGWAHALDFAILDEDGQSHLPDATLPEHFYCFGKPVLACADGVVDSLINHVPDNEIGQVNTVQNWGNCIVIRHLSGLYTQVSHLKQYSAKVNVGDFVKQGDLLALCGNSGRSPLPHLHFQAQAAPYIGSRTVPYPFAAYIGKQGADEKLFNFKIPEAGTVVSSLEINPMLKAAFSLQPGYTASMVTANGETQTWEVHTDSLNHTYLYSVQDDSMAYFVNNDTSFYFTSFFGNQSSLLYSFYLAAYRVVYSVGNVATVTDSYPLQMEGSHIGMWLHDLVAPFYRFNRRGYQSCSQHQHNKIIIHATEYQETAGSKKQVMEACIQIDNNGVAGFTLTRNKQKTEAQWYTVSTY